MSRDACESGNVFKISKSSLASASIWSFSRVLSLVTAISKRARKELTSVFGFAICDLRETGKDLFHIRLFAATRLEASAELSAVQTSPGHRSAAD
jgi:hypothetical protein